MRGVMIAGTSSGVGKTTVCMGLMAAFKQKGSTVLPFKVGPDYIDPGFHEFITQKPSYNLDAFLLDDQKLCYEYYKHSPPEGGIKIIEGVMGMHDGYGTIDPRSSSAHVAKVLDVPVLLVVDGSAVSTSAAATVLGFKNFDETVNIQGVIVNRVSGEPHYQMIKKAIEHYTGIPCVGYLKKNDGLTLSSRHLGLVPKDEIPQLNAMVQKLASEVLATVDLNAVTNIASGKPHRSIETPGELQAFLQSHRPQFQGKRMAIARSKAFSFYYRSNLEILDALGVELVPINPNVDEKLPAELDFLYLGGGFPEVFAEELSANLPFRTQLNQELNDGLRAYAECGGLMYLTNQIVVDGKSHPMTGFFNADAHMGSRLQRFGYVHVTSGDIEFPAHEYHYSYLESHEEIQQAYRVEKFRDGKLVREWSCGYLRNNVLGGYAHVMFLSNLKILKKVFCP